MAARSARTSLYQPDLAHVHTVGYGFHWEQAAPGIVAILRRAGIHSGMISDLGCGAGLWLAHLRGLGYDVSGIDVSPSMIRAARRRFTSIRTILSRAGLRATGFRVRRYRGYGD